MLVTDVADYLSTWLGGARMGKMEPMSNFRRQYPNIVANILDVAIFSASSIDKLTYYHMDDIVKCF